MAFYGLGDLGSRVEFDLHYEFSSVVLSSFYRPYLIELPKPSLIHLWLGPRQFMSDESALLSVDVIL